MGESKYIVKPLGRYWIIQPQGGGLAPMSLRGKYLTSVEAQDSLNRYEEIAAIESTKRKKRVKSKTKVKTEE